MSFSQDMQLSGPVYPRMLKIFDTLTNTFIHASIHQENLDIHML